MTAAVPQAKTSDSEPSSARLAPLVDRDAALLDREAELGGEREQRVAHDARQQRAGQRGREQPGAAVAAKTKNRFIPPISSTQRRSTASSQTTWSQPFSAAWRCASRLPA